MNSAIHSPHIRSACAVSAALMLVVALSHGAYADPAAERDGLPLVFSESFEDGMGRWVMTDDSAWEIVEEDGGGKALALTGSSDYEPPVRSPHSIARIRDLTVGDFILEARLKQTGREYGHRDLCLFFGWTAPDKYYYAHIATQADEHAHSVFLVNEAPRVSIADDRTEGVKWDDAYHTVVIKRDAAAGTIEVYFDDMETPIMRTVDRTFTSGGIGFGSFDDVGRFTDIRIWGEKE